MPDIVTVRLSARAEREVANRFLAELVSAQRMLAEHPEIGPIWRRRRVGPVVRRLTMLRFPFALFYLVRQTEIDIVAVAHTRKKPGYWLGRLRTHQ